MRPLRRAIPSSRAVLPNVTRCNNKPLQLQRVGTRGQTKKEKKERKKERKFMGRRVDWSKGIHDAQQESDVQSRVA